MSKRERNLTFLKNRWTPQNCPQWKIMSSKAGYEKEKQKNHVPMRVPEVRHLQRPL